MYDQQQYDNDNTDNESEIIALKPRKGSRKFKKEIIEEFYQKKPNSSEEKLIDSKPFNDERWDETREEAIPIFDHQLNKFGIIDPEDPTRSNFLRKNSDYLNRLVSKCYLQHEDWHPKKGEYITTADIRNPNDPFFIHDDTMKIIESGACQFNMDKPMDVIMLHVMLAQEDYAIGGARTEQHLSSKVRYVIVDNKIDRKNKKRLREKSRLVSSSLDKLSFDEARKVCMALGILQDATITNPDTIEELLWDYANDNITKVNNDLTQQDYYLEIITNGRAILDASYLFTMGVTYGVIKRQDLIYKAFGIPLGKNRDEAIKFISLPTQEQIALNIESAVKEYDRSNNIESVGASNINTGSIEDKDVKDKDTKDDLKNYSPKETIGLPDTLDDSIDSIQEKNISTRSSKKNTDNKE